MVKIALGYTTNYQTKNTLLKVLSLKLVIQYYKDQYPVYLEGLHTLLFSVPNSNQVISSISMSTMTGSPKTILQVFNASPPFSPSFNSGCLIGGIFLFLQYEVTRPFILDTLDIAIGPRMSLVAATCVRGKTMCYLYDYLEWKILKKVGWAFKENSNNSMLMELNLYSQLEAVTSLSFDSSGERLAAINQNGSIAFTNTIKGEKVSVLPGGADVDYCNNSPQEMLSYHIASLEPNSLEYGSTSPSHKHSWRARI